MATEFPKKARREVEDPADGWMTVQDMVLFLRDVFDSFVAGFSQGTATITSGNTTVVVSHGLNASTYRVSVIPLADPGGRVWVSGKTSSQFTINIGAAAPGPGIAFDWIIHREG